MSALSEPWRRWRDPERGPASEHPFDHRQVEIMRSGWHRPLVVNPREIHPATDGTGLLWRPVGHTTARSGPEPVGISND